ncbi:MAG: endonuclease/exonuclease/phosphatase family protein [Steroidobacteraceae bacterium]|nr:endonuclease/exonuclease/phosphatase family protein [Steroidobacteraceae bacterium]
MRTVSTFLILAAAGVLPVAAADPPKNGEVATIRIATFNSSLNRSTLGALQRDLSTPDNAQARIVAEIIQRVRPDILLLQEFDYDANGTSLRAFEANYLERAQNGSAPIQFKYHFFTESNTGTPSGLDLDNDGHVAGGADALGFGEFPGQYAMMLLSRFPIDEARARTFREFLWRNMPDARLPDDPATAAPADWYSDAELAVLPLSSKNHWDVPIRIGKRTLHVFASHPTPPAFDGPEDRNGLRNHDEVRFWNDYIAGEKYLRDDSGKRGGFRGGQFIVMGDLNSDPVDGASLKGAILSLLQNSRVNASVTPSSPGGAEAAAQGGMNASQTGDPRFDTADFYDRAVGNLRVDYLLPSKDVTVCAAGVFWPGEKEPHASLVWGEPPPSSDHRLVWIDVNVTSGRCPPGSDPTTRAP